MRTGVLFAIGILARAVVAAAAPQAEDDRAVTLESRVTAVTAYPDRARVTRAADVSLGGETACLAFRRLPGWMDEGSVRVSVVPASAAELLDVRVLKTFLARPDDAEIRKAEAAVQDGADQMAALDDERAVLDARSRHVDSIRAFSLEKLPKDTATREVKIEEYGNVVAYVADAMAEIAKARRGIETRRRALEPEQNARQRRLDELRQRGQLEQRTVAVSLKPAQAGKATVELTYMLPGATWEPAHDLRVAPGGGAVMLASFGVITQTTGEDWLDVPVTLSTQRATEPVRIPEATATLLRAGAVVGKALRSDGDTFQSAASAFDVQFGLWNAFANSAVQQVELEGNRREQQTRQARVTEIFRALQQQRGTTAHFAALAPQTVRTDGRPVRVPIGSAALAAEPRMVAVPEASLNAARVAELVNTGGRPLLPGRVHIYQDSAFLGTTDLDFVAQGETFSVYLGVADQIKLTRVLDRRHSALSWSGRRRRVQAAYIMTAENLSDSESVLELADSVPVSETDDIRVVNVRLTPSAKPDAKGLVRWDVRLAPRQTQEFRVEYTLDYAAQPPVPQGKPGPSDDAVAAPSVPAEEPLRGKIMELEHALM